MRLLNAWDMKIEPLSARSRLYSLVPVGIGTPGVESLTGYVARLAQAHCVNVTDLVALELSRPAALTPLVADHSYCRTYALNGVGLSPKRWCRALEEATLRDELSNLTLLGLEDLLWPAYLFRRRRAWCSACLADRKKAGLVVYEPLLWAIQAARLCPQHRQFLEEICPYCHRPTVPLTAYSRAGFCSLCRQWLGSTSEASEAAEKALSKSDLDYEFWISNEMGNLLALLPQLKGLPLGARLRDNLSSYVDQLTSGNLDEFCRVTKASRTVLRGWMTGQHSSRVDHLLRLCYYLHVPVGELLLGTAAPHVVPAVRKRCPGNNERRKDEILVALEKALIEDPAPTLTQVARRLNHDRTESLSRIAPELCKMVVARHQEAVNHLPRKGKHRICAKNEIRRTLEASLAQPRPTSVQRIAVKLGYCNGGCIRLEFPHLCRAIGKKLAGIKSSQRKNRALEFARILRQRALPSATKVCRRLGYRSLQSLRFNFPRPYRQLLALRRAQHASGKEHVRTQIQRLLSDGPAISVRQVCRRVGLSLGCLYRLYPDLCWAIAEKRRRHWNVIVAARACRLRKAIFSAVMELDRKGFYPTHSRVRPFLDSDLQKRWVESGQFLREAKQHLGIPTRDMETSMKHT